MQKNTFGEFQLMGKRVDLFLKQPLIIKCLSRGRVGQRTHVQLHGRDLGRLNEHRCRPRARTYCRTYQLGPSRSRISCCVLNLNKICSPFWHRGQLSHALVGLTQVPPSFKCRACDCDCSCDAAKARLLNRHHPSKLSKHSIQTVKVSSMTHCEYLLVWYYYLIISR